MGKKRGNVFIQTSCTVCWKTGSSVFVGEQPSCEHCGASMPTVDREQGYVYCFSNQAMPDLIKVGMTHMRPCDRRDDLFTAGVPLPFDMEFYFACRQPTGDERIALAALDKPLVKDREFFQLAPEVAQAKIISALRRYPIFSRYRPSDSTAVPGESV